MTDRGDKCPCEYYDPSNGNVQCFMTGPHEWHRGNVKYVRPPNGIKQVKIEWRYEDE